MRIFCCNSADGSHGISAREWHTTEVMKQTEQSRRHTHIEKVHNGRGLKSYWYTKEIRQQFIRILYFYCKCNDCRIKHDMCRIFLSFKQGKFPIVNFIYLDEANI